MVPLAFRGATFGVLVAIDRVEHGPHFSTEDEQLLEAFATSAATAIATAESVVAERRGQRLAAAEQEPTRWARELHDETLQGMAALRLALGAALRSGKTDAIADAVRRALEELDEEIAVLRALITDLRPAALDQIGAEAAIEALADRCRGLGLEVDVHLDLAYEQARAPERLDEDLEIAIYRIVQEALTNARKHGGARRAVVEVREGEITVDLSVRDDGSGFEPSSPTDGFGIAGMRERVDLLNGTLTISSTPGNGTTVSASFPARRRRDGRDEPRSLARGG